MIALIPLRNQANRIQPLFRYLEKNLIKSITHFIFIDESSQDDSLHVLGLETQKLSTPYTLLKNEIPHRGNSLELGFSIAKDLQSHFIIVFNEGWEDNIEEMNHIITSKEYKNYSMITSVRKPRRRNLGARFDSLANRLLSLKFNMPIPDCKGDSINLYKVPKEDKLSLKCENTIQLQLLKDYSYRKEPVLFTIVDNGLNSQSFIKLNFKWFISIMSFFLFK